MRYRRFQAGGRTSLGVSIAACGIAALLSSCGASAPTRRGISAPDPAGVPGESGVRERASQRPQVFILSDIDDTLKATHVGSFVDLVRNGLRAGKTFSGLPELFRGLHAQGNIYPYYVSAAAGRLQGGGKAFLKKYDFPLADWTFYGKPDIFDDTKKFKVRRIEYLIRTFIQPAEMILVGDNGERDVDDFVQVMRDLPEVKITSYVHLVYDASASDARIGPKAPGRPYAMLPWLTSLDLGLRWVRQLGLEAGILVPVADRVVRDLDAEELIPDWVECTDFWRRYAEDPIDGAGSLGGSLRLLEEKLGSRCKLPH